MQVLKVKRSLHRLLQRSCCLIDGKKQLYELVKDYLSIDVCSTLPVLTHEPFPIVPETLVLPVYSTQSYLQPFCNRHPLSSVDRLTRTTKFPQRWEACAYADQSIRQMTRAHQDLTRITIEIKYPWLRGSTRISGEPSTRTRIRIGPELHWKRASYPAGYGYRVRSRRQPNAPFLGSNQCNQSKVQHDRVHRSQWSIRNGSSAWNLQYQYVPPGICYPEHECHCRIRATHATRFHHTFSICS